MPDEIELMDKDDADAIRYPTIKNVDDIAQEIRVTTKVRDITIPGIDSTVYFPLNFCIEDTVIDAVAKKYNADIENYPDNEDDEHFLIGTKACRKGRKSLNCKYMKKVNVKIDATPEINQNEIFAIYLLMLDDSNENRQKFLLMTKDRLYILYSTQKVESYPYKKIRFTPDGVELRELGEDVSQNLLEYTFDERFLNFAHEFKLMRCTTLVDVRERHPFAHAIDDKKNPDMVSDMKINVSETDQLPVTRKRHAYMKFLVDTAAAEGYLEAKTIMRLYYMAREFKISADEMLSWLKQAAEGGIRKNKLQAEFTKTLEFLGFKYKFVFVQDLLEVGTDRQGNFHRQELLKIMKRPQFALEKFVGHYLNFIVKRNAAEFELQNAFQNIDGKEICFKHSVRTQNYGNRLNLQLTAMGAMLNEQ